MSMRPARIIGVTALVMGLLIVIALHFTGHRDAAFGLALAVIIAGMLIK